MYRGNKFFIIKVNTKYLSFISLVGPIRTSQGVFGWFLLFQQYEMKITSLTSVSLSLQPLLLIVEYV